MSLGEFAEELSVFSQNEVILIKGRLIKRLT